jgi:group II intron reverse transcriptase/maturase
MLSEGPEMTDVNSSECMAPGAWVESFRQKLYVAAKANKERNFGILFDKVIKEETLKEAWRRVAANGGSRGVDGQTIEWIRKDYGVEPFLVELRSELAGKTYRPELVRRVYIPKGDGDRRPLGIPTVKDRVVQMAVKLIIEPLFEVDFLDCSWGYRPNRSAQTAAQVVHRVSNSQKWVVDMDLKSYFDTIDQDLLMALVRRRVRDPRVLYLIRGWLKAGILDGGIVLIPETGTPQGGVLSPLLANIFLHEFDRQWNPKDGHLTRYADDMVIQCWSLKQAELALQKARGILSSLKLIIHPTKTRVCHVKDGFDFLGFTFKEAWSVRQRRAVRIKFPRAKSCKKFRERLKEKVQAVPLGQPLAELVKMVNASIRGWVGYFRIGNSYTAAEEVSQFACMQLRIYLRRCKQRKDIQGTRRWPNAFFYDQGVLYAPKLLTR